MKLESPLSATASSNHAALGKAQRHRILVTDDEEGIRSFSADVLRQLGYEVDTAEDGAAAWAALSATRYDLLITDNKMPRVSGLELLEKLRLAQMALPVIMATGTLPTEEFVRRPWLTPDAMLLKPYTGEDLLTKVNELLSSATRSGKRNIPRKGKSLAAQVDLQS